MRRWPVAVAVAALVAAGCAGAAGDEGLAPPARGDAVVVASFDFAESELLAEIYAQALEDEGVTVARQFALGSRELVLPALRQGFIDVVPEYAGSALDATAPTSSVDRADVAAVVAELGRAVGPWGVDVLTPASAANQNALAVTADFAARAELDDVSDLAPLAATLTVGGPPECPGRPRCLVGLAERYGVEFGSFVPMAGQTLVRRALEDGVIDVGVMFTTDAALAGASLVVLDDDRDLQSADNVVPLVRAAAVDDRAIAALDEVSARMTTTNLRFLNWRVANAGAGAAAEARAWLVRHGLVAR